jgi:hypothetical protein
MRWLIAAGNKVMLLRNNFKPLIALAPLMRELAVYASIALLPGGSLIALAVWALRQRRRSAA